MSTAEDLRQEVRDVITDHQRNEPTQSHAERYGSENTEESSTPPQPEEKKKEVKVSDKPVKKKLTVTDRMTSLLTPDQLKEIEEQENKENVGKMDITDDKNEKLHADFDPIKIEQGDFIDFLMKDIVIAGTQWIGGKVIAQPIAVVSYSVARFGYHKLLRDPYRWGKEKYQERKARSEKQKKEALEENLKSYEKMTNLEPSPDDDATTAFSKTVRLMHNNTLKAINTLKAAENIDLLTQKAIDGTLENIQDSNLPPHINASLQKMAQAIKAQNLTDEQKANLKEYLHQQIDERLLTEHNAIAFASLMTATVLMNKKNKDQNFDANMSPKEISRQYSAIYLKYQQIFYNEINNEQGKYKTPEALVKAANEAFVTEKENVLNGHYNEKGKIPTNNKLEEINHNFNYTPNGDERYGSRADHQAEALKNNTQEIESLTALKEKNNKRRNNVNQTKDRIKENKKVKKQENSHETPSANNQRNIPFNINRGRL